jgi:hypothetical protein
MQRTTVIRAFAALLAAVIAGPARSASAAPTRRPSVDLVLNGGAQNAGMIQAKPHLGGYVDVQINDRSTQAARGLLTFYLPAGWRTTVDQPTAGQSCALHGHRSVCKVGRLTRGTERHVEFIVHMAKDVPYRKSTAVRMHIAPIGASDPRSQNNDSTLHVINSGTSDMITRITQSAKTVAKHRAMSFTVTLTNRGPDPATMVNTGFLVITRKHDGFLQTQPKGRGKCEAGSAGPVDAMSPYLCTVRSVGAGHSVVYQVSWRGAKVGAVGHLKVEMWHDGYDPGAKTGSVGMQYIDRKSGQVRVTTS